MLNIYVNLACFIIERLQSVSDKMSLNASMNFSLKV